MDTVTLKQSCMRLAKTLLNLGLPTERAIVQRLIGRVPAGHLAQAEKPSAELISHNTMGGGNHYPLELTIGGMTIGLSVMTNYDRVGGPINAYMEIVPVYVKRGAHVHWWAFESDTLLFTLLNNQILTMAVAASND